MFVDASALVAILMREPGWEALANCLDGAPHPTTSGLAVYETVVALARMKDGDVGAARAEVGAFCAAAGLTIVDVEPQDADAALAAFARYGKGRAHPAKLNMGDCFAHALAERHGAALLFKGNDFPHTDIVPALP